MDSLPSGKAVAKDVFAALGLAVAMVLSGVPVEIEEPEEGVSVAETALVVDVSVAVFVAYGVAVAALVSVAPGVTANVGVITAVGCTPFVAAACRLSLTPPQADKVVETSKLAATYVHTDLYFTLFLLT